MLRPGKVLAVVQVALSLLLLISVRPLRRSMQALTGDSFGVLERTRARRARRAQGSDQRNVPGTTARLDRIYRELVDKVLAIPGVRMASIGQSTPTSPLGSAGTQLTLPSGETLRVPMATLTRLLRHDGHPHCGWP